MSTKDSMESGPCKGVQRLKSSNGHWLTPRPLFATISRTTSGLTEAPQCILEASSMPQAPASERERFQRLSQRRATYAIHCADATHTGAHWTWKSKCHKNHIASDHPSATWRHAWCVVMHGYHGHEVSTRELMPTTPPGRPRRAFFPGGRRLIKMWV